MTDLPPDRAEIGPPFINIACDVFGPWAIQSKKTRGRVALKKLLRSHFHLLGNRNNGCWLLHICPEKVLLYPRTSLVTKA